MDVIPDRGSRVAQGRTSARILNTKARSVHRSNVGRQTRRPTLRNVHFVMLMPLLLTAGSGAHASKKIVNTFNRLRNRYRKIVVRPIIGV